MMRFPQSTSVALLTFLIATLASILELKLFVSWNQVLGLWEREINPLSIIGHAHMPRYAIAYPGFLLNEYLPVIGFSLYICIFVAINFMLLRAIALLAIFRLPSLVAYIMFAVIHIAMNGRGVIAWTAWLLCIWVCTKIHNKIAHPLSQLVWVAIGCFLATVSTGVFIVVISTFLFFILEHLYSSPRGLIFSRSILFICLVAPLGFLTQEYFLLAIEKNISYYGGGIVGVYNMLEHGIGAVFIEITPLNFLFVPPLVFGAFVFAYKAILGSKFSLLARLTLIPVVGGLFGYTVLALAIAPLLLQLDRWRRLSLNLK